MRPASVRLVFGLGLLGGACAGGGARPAAPTSAPSATAAAPAPAPLAEPAASGEQASAAPWHAVDPLATRALIAKSGEAPGDAPLGLHLELVEFGPDAPWVVGVINRGTEAARVAFDPRLLSFEIEPQVAASDTGSSRSRNPQSKPSICALPAALVPAFADDDTLIDLEPGQGVVENVNPRLYCMLRASGAPLLPGAQVAAHLGWPLETRLVYRHGQRERVPVAQREPFVAWPVAAQGSLPQAAADGSSRVKELRASAVTLGAEYAPEKPSSHADEPLALSVSGSDARDESSATLTVTLRNQSGKPLALYFRREFVTLEVVGPDRVVTCDPQPDHRSPDRQAFGTLGRNGSLSAVSRLAELCPAGTFARPGLYLIHARFDSDQSGSQFGLHAFTGRVVSDKPAQVRIRSGEGSFLGRRAVERVYVGH